MAGISFPVGATCIAHVTGGATPRLAVLAAQEASTAEDQGRALAELVRAHGLRGTDGVLVLTRGDYQLLQLDAPEVEAAELKGALRWRLKDLIDFHIDDAVFDVFSLPEPALHGRARQIIVAVARTSTLRALIERSAAAGLRLFAIDIPELALRNLGARLPEEGAGLALVRLDEEDGLINLTRGGELYLTRRIEIGARHFRNLDDSGGLIEQLALEVQRSLDYYESHFGQVPLRMLTVAPHTADADLAERTAASLGLRAQALALDAVVKVSNGPPAELVTRCLDALGGALRVREAA
jgi:MSHA biogenesis protein MshI